MSGSVEEISPDEVKERIDADGDVQVIDIRPPDEFAAGHIPGAENVPLSRFAREVARHEWGEEIVVACPIGQSSIQAARLLESYEGVPEGARVASMRGGYAEWGYELETGDASG